MYTSNAKCIAFPNGIPTIICCNEFIHNKPYKGDNGIMFEGKKEEYKNIKFNLRRVTKFLSKNMTNVKNDKISINNNIKILKRNNIDNLKRAQDFFENYGVGSFYSLAELEKEDKERDILFTADLERVFSKIDSINFINITEKKINEKVSIIGMLDKFNLVVMISKSGQFFTEEGFFSISLDEDINEFWRIVVDSSK